MNATPRIAIVGCGALGSYYGACLARSGQDVHFLLRSDFEAVRDRGVRVLSAGGNFTAHPHSAVDPAAIGPCDLVLIGLKTTANHALATLLPPLLKPGTAVLTLQNGLGNEEILAALVGADRVLGGLCFVCLNRIEPGVIHHLAHGRIVMGEYGGAALVRTHAIAGMFHKAGIPCDVTDRLERAHWEKLVWNIPFNGLGVASVAGYESVVAGRVLHPDRREKSLATDALLADSRWLGLVRELMEETLMAANMQGLDLPLSVADEQIERTRQMGSYRASTLIDFERGSALELESLFLEPLRRARAVGFAAPRLTALCQVLGELDAAKSPV